MEIVPASCVLVPSDKDRLDALRSALMAATNLSDAATLVTENREFISSLTGVERDDLYAVVSKHNKKTSRFMICLEESVISNSKHTGVTRN